MANLSENYLVQVDIRVKSVSNSAEIPASGKKNRLL